MENWIQIGNNQKNKTDRFREDERSYIVQGLVSVWITGKGLLQTNSDDVRMRQIVKYVDENRQNHVSLSELADEMFTATSTLSRLFQKQTGMKFAEFVNRVRIYFAAEDLMTTSKAVTKIAVDNGFSNASVMNRVFRQYYQCTPVEYREKKKEEKECTTPTKKENRDKRNKNKSLDTENSAIEVNVRRKSKLTKIWNQVVNIGSVYNLTLANLQYHTIYLTETLGFSYVRIWNVFSKKMMITDGKTQGNYNYDMIDLALDFLVSHHIKPFVDLGRRPDTVLSSMGNTLYFEEECIVFQSKDIWIAMLKDFIHHIIKRYGKEEVVQWKFELSSDIVHFARNQYYIDKEYDYKECYRSSYQVIKKALPDACVGGPSDVTNDVKFLHEYLQYSKENNCLPEFISILLFPYDSSRKDGKVNYYRTQSENYEYEKLQSIHQIMEEGEVDIPLYVVEWNSSISNRNFLNDSCFRASYITKKIIEILSMADMVCLWMGSDWVSNYFDTKRIANGGSGLITKDTIRKPVYFALQFLNQLGEELLLHNEELIVTKEIGKDVYHIIGFHYQKYEDTYVVANDPIDSPEKVEKIFLTNQECNIDLVLKNVADGNYTITSNRICREKGSILDEWKKFQYEETLTNEDIKYLREITQPERRMEGVMSVEGRVQIRMTLRGQEIILLHVSKDDAC
ncbi:helix-turn-helix domain-containing protein [Mediterraneibacter sp. NSJ-151]|uniref:GH39 family glycosyl hydrolase n=1 Tax=Mediterraneibacter sp. NSJ-151 TaxID=2897708 RepID=UPI001F0AF338|nr:helix-turn-helix domain-containing protein [Mediterraneibacter sp. NSJ-151]MCH4280191.1 helix-turn-helix domain-containing protein [Mediterraneibacter sp. NSJ-151]